MAMTNFSFKYASHVNGHPNCPPSTFQIPKCVGYRFVYLTNPDKSFLPPCIKAPARRLKTSNEEKKCSAFALSFFDSESAARQSFDYLKSLYRSKIYLIIGTHLAKGNLDSSHGIVTPTDAHGHFDLFESSLASWSISSLSFNIIGAL
jgi:hypothetical protein